MSRDSRNRLIFDFIHFYFFKAFASHSFFRVHHLHFQVFRMAPIKNTYFSADDVINHCDSLLGESSDRRMDMW